MKINIEIKLNKRERGQYEEYRTPFGVFRIYKTSDGAKLHIDGIPRMWFPNKKRARRFVRMFVINRIHELIENYKP